MALSELAVLLRNCKHDNNTTSWASNGTGKERYALKCDTFSVQLAKTPIQIPVPQQSPELIDLGIFRPSISIGGLVDNIGQDTTNTTSGFQNMESIPVTRNYWQAANNYTDVEATYYIPYKNKLEEIVYKWIATDASGAQLELEIGDANYPRYNTAAEPNDSGSTDNNISAKAETGGGVYVVALQQARFQVDPGAEDRWTFQMQFVCESRKDVQFS